VRPLIITLVVFVCNRRDGRVATFRPIPQSVSGVGVRFSIGDKIRNLGEKSFCLTRRESTLFILLQCCSHISVFILTELGVGLVVGDVVAFLWRGARGGFGGLAWHPPIALTGWGQVECEIPTPCSHDMMYPLANGGKNLDIFCSATGVRLELVVRSAVAFLSAIGNIDTIRSRTKTTWAVYTDVVSRLSLYIALYHMVSAPRDTISHRLSTLPQYHQ
jgi:hypothetical protein